VFEHLFIYLFIDHKDPYSVIPLKTRLAIWQCYSRVAGCGAPKRMK